MIGVSHNREALFIFLKKIMYEIPQIKDGLFLFIKLDKDR